MELSRPKRAFRALLCSIAILLALSTRSMQALDFTSTHSGAPYLVIGWGAAAHGPVAAINIGFDIYVYRSHDTQGHLWYIVGGAQPRQIPNTTTIASPTLVQIDGTVYIFHTGIDGQIYWDHYTDTGFLGNWQRIPDVGGNQTNGHEVFARTQPAVTVTADGHFVVAATFTDDRMRTVILDRNNQIEGWRELPGQTDFAIATTRIGANRFWFQHTGQDSNEYFNIGRWNPLNGLTFAFPIWLRVPGGALSNEAPEVLGEDSGSTSFVILGILGTDGRPWAEVLDVNNQNNEVTAEPGGNVAPQGDADGFVVNSDGPPSVAQIRGDEPANQTHPNLIISGGSSGLIIRKRLDQ